MPYEKPAPPPNPQAHSRCTHRILRFRAAPTRQTRTPLLPEVGSAVVNRWRVSIVDFSSRYSTTRTAVAATLIPTCSRTCSISWCPGHPGVLERGWRRRFMHPSGGCMSPISDNLTDGRSSWTCVKLIRKEGHVREDGAEFLHPAGQTVARCQEVRGRCAECIGREPRDRERVSPIRAVIRPSTVGTDPANGERATCTLTRLMIASTTAAKSAAFFCALLCSREVSYGQRMSTKQPRARVPTESWHERNRPATQCISCIPLRFIAPNFCELFASSSQLPIAPDQLVGRTIMLQLRIVPAGKFQNDPLC